MNVYVDIEPTDSLTEVAEALEALVAVTNSHLTIESTGIGFGVCMALTQRGVPHVRRNPAERVAL